MQEEFAKEVRRGFPASVVRVVDEYTVVMNRGRDDGVRQDQRFLVYALGDELTDPETGESLGQLELVKGTGRIVHVQERMATLRSDRQSPPEKRVVVRTRKDMGGLIFPSNVTEEETITPSRALSPFDEPKAGDKAKPI